MNNLVLSVSRNDVPTPVIKNKRRKLRFTDELTTIGKKVTVYPSGRVKVHKDNKNNETSDDENDEEIIKAAAKVFLSLHYKEH